MKAFCSAALGAAFFVSASHPVGAAPCYPREEILEMLEGRYGEAPVGRGLATTGVVVEVFVSATGGSWTLTVTLPNGTTCAVAAGEHWEAVAPEPRGERS